MDSRSKVFHLRKRFIVILLGTLISLAGLWLALEWNVSNLEKTVWDSHEFQKLKAQKGVLKAISENRITPAKLRLRMFGLRGDLAFHEHDFDTACTHYIVAMNRRYRKCTLERH